MKRTSNVIAGSGKKEPTFQGTSRLFQEEPKLDGRPPALLSPLPLDPHMYPALDIIVPFTKSELQVDNTTFQCPKTGQRSQQT